MTRQVAISFFEDDEFGYVVGSDTASILYKQLSLTKAILIAQIGKISDKLANWMIGTGELVFQDKSFIGENFVGFVWGRYRSVSTGVSNSSAALRTLDGVFNDISDNKIYQIPLFRHSDDYQLLIGKNDNDFAELYTVTSENQVAVARRIHQVTPDSNEPSRVWYKSDLRLSTDDAPNGYWQETLEGRLDLLSARSKSVGPSPRPRKRYSPSTKR